MKGSKTQQLMLQFRSHKNAWRAQTALRLLIDAGILPRSLGFKWSTKTPRQVTLYIGDEP